MSPCPVSILTLAKTSSACAMVGSGVMHAGGWRRCVFDAIVADELSTPHVCGAMRPCCCSCSFLWGRGSCCIGLLRRLAALCSVGW